MRPPNNPPAGSRIAPDYVARRTPSHPTSYWSHMASLSQGELVAESYYKAPKRARLDMLSNICFRPRTVRPCMFKRNLVHAPVNICWGAVRRPFFTFGKLISRETMRSRSNRRLGYGLCWWKYRLFSLSRPNGSGTTTASRTASDKLPAVPDLQRPFLQYCKRGRRWMVGKTLLANLPPRPTFLDRIAGRLCY